MGVLLFPFDSGQHVYKSNIFHSGWVLRKDEPNWIEAPVFLFLYKGRPITIKSKTMNSNPYLHPPHTHI